MQQTIVADNTAVYRVRPAADRAGRQEVAQLQSTTPCSTRTSCAGSTPRPPTDGIPYPRDLHRPVRRPRLGLLSSCCSSSSRTFLLSHAIPADPARAAAGARRGGPGPGRVASARARPAAVGSVRTYMGNVLHGNLGISYVSRTSIAPQLTAAVPATLELVVYELPDLRDLRRHRRDGWAWRPRKLGTHLIRGTSILGTALPVFWFAIILQLVFAARLGWFPIEGRLEQRHVPPPHITASTLWTRCSPATGTPSGTRPCTSSCRCCRWWRGCSR